MKRLDRSEITFKIISYVLLTIFALACLYPFVFIVMNSISSAEYVDASKVSVIPLGFQLKARALKKKINDQSQEIDSYTFEDVYINLQVKSGVVRKT